MNPNWICHLDLLLSLSARLINLGVWSFVRRSINLGQQYNVYIHVSKVTEDNYSTCEVCALHESIQEHEI